MKSLLVMLFSLFFVTVLSGAAFVQGKNYPLNTNFTGQVTSVDFLSKELIAMSNNPLLGGSTFTMSDLTKVTMCGQLRTVQDIKAGEKVTITYHETNGKLYADAIELPTPLVACLLPVE